jgi:hypothetical protein
MSIVQRVVLLLKVLVLLSLGMSTAWAHNPVQSGVAVSAVQSGQGKVLQLAKSESEPGDEGQGGSKGDDDSDDEGAIARRSPDRK